MSKFRKLKELSRRNYQRAVVGVGLLFSAGFASAQAAPTLETVLDTFVASIIAGVGTTFAKVGPLLALVFGVAFAWRWIKKGSKS